MKLKCDHRSKFSNLSNWKVEAWKKKIRASMCGFIAQLVEHRTGIAEVMGSNPVEALIFFRLLLPNCLNWKIYCDDHTSLSSHTAVQIWIISYMFHIYFIVFTEELLEIVLAERYRSVIISPEASWNASIKAYQLQTIIENRNGQ